jgi:hypothetical protein
LILGQGRPGQDQRDRQKDSGKTAGKLNEFHA